MNLSSAIEPTLSPRLRAASVRVSRQVRAAPERIFDVLLDADAVRSFLFTGRLGEAVSVQFDARVGGGFRIVLHRDGEDVEYSGAYLELDRPHRLVFSLFVARYGQQDDRVIVELAPVAEQSLLVLTHELSLPDPAERSRVQDEWAAVLDGLDALCAEGGVAHAPAETRARRHRSSQTGLPIG